MPAKRRGAISLSNTSANSIANNSAPTFTTNHINNNNMAFAAPAPAPGGFSFASSSSATPAPAFGAAPAPAQGGAFGATAAPVGFSAPSTNTGFGAAPATALGGFGAAPAAPATGGLFGAAPAPATGGFGAAPATGGLFGASPAPATGGFGAAPALATGGLFGSTPAPLGGAFGATPAPSAFGFGAAPAPAPSAFGATGGFGGNSFGAAQAQAPQPLPSANLAGFMSYSSLPSDQKNSVDSVYQTIMNHKRTILAVSTMAPKLLDISIQQADEAAGQKGEVGLIVTVQRLTGQVHQLEQQLKSLHDSIMHTRKNYETTTTQAICNAKWPTEFVAQRVGITLSNNEGNNRTATTPSSKEKEFDRQLKALLDSEMIHTDQVSRMPSPYLWKTLEEMEERSRLLKGKLEHLKSCLEISKEVSTEEFDIVAVVRLQEQTIWKVAADLTNVHTKIDQLRQLYNIHERGTNVLEAARLEEIIHQQQLDQQLRSMMVKNLPATLPAVQRGAFSAAGAPATGGGLFGGTTPTMAAPATGGLFGKSPAPATGLFGAAPAPVGGGLFGAAPAPATSFGSPAPIAGGGLFGAAPAAPAGGGLLGAAPAPATGGFGAAPAPVGGGLFGAAPAPPGGAFGSASAPTTGLFGAAPAPTGGALFGATSTAAATPKSKSRRSTTRRR